MSSIEHAAPIDAEVGSRRWAWQAEIDLVVHGTLFAEFEARDHHCVWFDVATTRASAVLFSDGFGDGDSPGAAGYGADDELVAITWSLRTGSWVLAGIPGIAPQPVLDQIEAALAHG